MRGSLRAISFSLSLALTATLAAPARSQEASGPRSPELFFAIGQQDIPAVRALLARGVSANSQNTLGMSALMIASAVGNPEVVRTLLDAGADTGYVSVFGSSLTFATFEPKPEVVNLLLARGADASASRPDRMTALMLAARSGNPEVVRALLARRVDVSAADNQGATALTYAARAGRAEALRILLDAGARVNGADAAGWTPLMHAAVNGHAEALSLLLRRGANLHARDKQGRTALLLASGYGDHPRAVRVLLSAGARLTDQDARGRTALRLATTRGYSGAAAVLREKGGKLAKTIEAAPRTPRQAAELSLRRIEQGMQVFAKRTGCVSCHHEGIARFTTGFAKAHGYSVDGAFAQQQEARVLKALEEMVPQMRKAVEDPAEIQNIPIVDVGDLAPTNGSMLLGMGAHSVKPSEPLALAAVALARTQTPDGDWRFALVREPVQSSFFTMTAMAVRAIQTYAPKQHAAEMEQRIQRAKGWLLKAETRNSEDRAFRLLGLKWAGATPDERRKAVGDLLAKQRPDGGWGQLDGLQSDAYATGSALFALAEGGELPVSSPAYQRGIRFLLRTQDEDGTWYVNKRAIPANNYFDAGYSHGFSQYASHAGACWATLALILADGRERGSRETAASR